MSHLHVSMIWEKKGAQSRGGAATASFDWEDEDQDADGSAAGDDAFGAELVGLRSVLGLRALAWAKTPAAAEDLIQATMERALTNRHLFQRGSNLKAWTTSIMRNLFIDGWRCAANRVDPIDPESLTRGAPEELSLGPLDLLDEADVREALAGLPPRDRVIFELAYFDRVSYRGLAQRLGLRPGTVGTRLFRVRAKLRAELEQLFRQRSACFH